MKMYDLLVVGAGPSGLSVALTAKKRGLEVVVLERGPIAHHLINYPVAMSFFTTKASMELSGIPFDCKRDHPTREEAISYYGRVAQLADLSVRTRTTVERIEGGDGDFVVVARSVDGEERFHTKKVVLAVGVSSNPRRLSGVPGVELEKFSYGYRDPAVFQGQEVLIVGAGNGSAEAALRLFHAGARVTVIDRGRTIPESKWRWHLPDLRDLQRSEAIRVFHSTTLKRVEPRHVELSAPAGEVRLANDAVIALLGFSPDLRLLESAGVHFDAALNPRIDARTLETERRGLYLAGIVVSGVVPDKVFIVGGRHHARAILAHVLGEPPPVEDLDFTTHKHWKQFEAFEEPSEPAWAMELVPEVGGELRDDAIDIYAYQSEKLGLGFNELRAVHVPRTFQALEGWLIESTQDGAIVYKGKRLSETSAEILRLADGTRRVREIAAHLAREHQQNESEVAEMVSKLCSSLFRSGRLIWRAAPRAAGRGL